MNKNMEKFLEWLSLFSSIILQILLIILLYFSFRYWNANYPYSMGLDARMFYLAVGIAIATVIAQWSEGRIKSIIKSIRFLKGGKHEEIKKA